MQDFRLVGSTSLVWREVGSHWTIGIYPYDWALCSSVALVKGVALHGLLVTDRFGFQCIIGDWG